MAPLCGIVRLVITWQYRLPLLRMELSTSRLLPSIIRYMPCALAMEQFSGTTKHEVQMKRQGYWLLQMESCISVHLMGAYNIYTRLAQRGGVVLWSRQFQERNGPGLAVNDGVIYASAGNALFALRANNGAVLWTHRLENTISLEASSIAGSFLYTLGDNGYVYALRIEDGRLQWSSKIAEHASSASPLILMNGIIFVASFGGFNIAGNNPKTAGGNVYALRANNGRIIWQKNLGFNDIPIMAIDIGIVYVTSGVPPNNDTLYALRPGDGSTLWSKSLNGL